MNNEKLIKKYIDESLWEDSFKKLKNGHPIQYIIGNVDFFGYEFSVNKNVLIPRFETETLVEKTINYIKKLDIPDIKIADLGTGSGCIGITLEKELKANVTCFDISNKALEVTKINKEKLCSSVKLSNYDILKEIPGKYNVIISNPPYIDLDDIIDDLVRDNEPHIALFADNHGLIFYEKILEYSKNVLEEKNLIAFEIGCTQGDSVKCIACKYYKEESVFVEKDLTGKDRFVFIINE